MSASEDEDYNDWYLGDDYDCETCGTTWNRIELDLDEDIKSWSVVVHTGCYGVESVSSRDDNAIEKLEALYKHLYLYPGFDSTVGEEITERIHVARARWARDDYLILSQRVAYESSQFVDRLGDGA